MFLVIAAFLAVCVLSSYLTTTSQQRAESRARLARWNPLFIAIIIAQLAFILWPRPPHGP
jgi:hypothetical protein